MKTKVISFLALGTLLAGCGTPDATPEPKNVLGLLSDDRKRSGKVNGSDVYVGGR